MIFMTRPLQVYIDEGDLERLEVWARARGWTKSQAVRAAIRALTCPHSEDPLLAASGMIDGLPEDVSVKFHRYFLETFVVEPRTAYRRQRRGAKAGVRR